MPYWQRIGAPSPEAAYLDLCHVIHTRIPEFASAAYAPGLRWLVLQEW